MTKLREQTIDKIAQTLYFNFEKVERGTVPDCNWKDFPKLRLEWKLKAEKLLELVPELAIVNREANLPNLQSLSIMDYVEKMMNGGWVKEVRE